MTASDSGSRSRDAEHGSGESFASIYVQQLRVQSFRGIADCSIDFESDLTLMVGRNNAGKTRLLRALGIALGTISSDRDDLTVGSSEPALIDVVLAPSSDRVAAGEVFESRAARRLGAEVQVLK